MDGVVSFEFRELEAFVAVARANSMTGAAQVLGLTQPAVSQIIKNLEERLGVALLDRQTRPLRLTMAGDKLYDAAQDLLARSTKVAAEFNGQNQILSHRLSVAIIDSLSGILAPRLAGRMENAVSRWQFFAGLTPDREQDFSTGRCDVAIVAEGQATSQVFVDQSLILREPYLKVFPRGYDKDVHDLKEVSKSLRFVRYSLASTAGRSVEQHLNRLRLRLPLWIESDSPLAQLQLIAGGNCWGYLTPTFLLNAPHLLDQIKVIRPRGPKFYRRIVLLSRHGQFDQLPDTLSTCCRAVLAEDLLPSLFEQFPWIEDFVEVPGHFPPGGQAPH